MQNEKLHEECGLIGIISPKPLHTIGLCSSALLALQHRGQESAGVATFFDGRVKIKKEMGLVVDVFTSDFLEYTPNTKVAIGHVRYSAHNTSNIQNAQPEAIEDAKLSMAMAYNGNITNLSEIRNNLIAEDFCKKSDNDCDVINKLVLKYVLDGNELEKAIEKTSDVLEGAFCILFATKDKLIAVRDKNGFRPLCMGKMGDAIVFASETCALDALSADFVKDVAAGEIITVNLSGEVNSKQLDVSRNKQGLCCFEYVYFARPDSVIDGVSVSQARVEMGKALYNQRPTQADMVCGVPDSGLEAARGYSLASGIPLVPGFIKNKYIGRSFILPTQVQRENAVNIKLNPIRANVKDKRVILIDDSIVRSTTSIRIIKMLRRAGAKEVHLRISSPPFKHTCHFGTDIDSVENLIANKMSVEQICKHINADSLEYLSLESLRSIAPFGMCEGCFTGEYPLSAGLLVKDKFNE